MHNNRIKNLISLVFQRVYLDLRVKYRGSFLGLLWSFFIPLTTAFIFFFLFKDIMAIHLVNNTDFFAYVFSGIIVVNLFTSSLNQSIEVVSNNSHTLRHFNLPISVFQAISSLSILIHSFFATIVLSFYSVYADLGIRWTILLTPLLLMGVSLFSFPISCILCLVASHFKDLRFILPQLLTLVVFLTPVFYHPSALPDNIAQLISLNPMHHFVNAFRSMIGVDMKPISFGFLGMIIIFSLFAVALFIPMLEKRRSQIVFRI